MDKILGLLCILALTKNSESAITAWTAPGTIGTASGSFEITTSKAENSVAVGAEIFTATATGTTPTYKLISSTDNVGVMVAGVVNVATGKALDFETAAKYIFVVEATDADSSKGTATVTLTITNVDEAPVFSPAVQGLCATTGSAAGTIVGILSGTDPEKAAVTYAITGGNTNTDFEISGSNLKAKNALNMKTTSGYALTITGTDATAKVGTLTLYVSVSIAGASVVVVSSLGLIMALASSIYL